MQGQAAFAQSITPQNFGAPIQPAPQTQPTQSPFAAMANFAGQVAGGYGAITGQMPGTTGYNQAMEQMQLQGMGAIAGPGSPFPMNQMFTGMQQQFATNRMLEQQFQHVRPGGRGFTPTQQLQIGAGMQQMAGQTPFVGMGELTQVMQQGSQMGQFSGVRDVQGVMRKTRELLKNWQDIAVELNTTLSEAGKIAGQLQQMGIFRSGQQAQALRQMGGMAAVTGIGVTQQAQMGALGAQMAPQMFGQGVGVRAAGAQAMQSQVQAVGAAAQFGVISQEQIFEATGQTGMAGQAALAQRMNQGAARFMKRGRGKVTMAAFVDPDTMQIDDAAVQRFMSGNMNLGEIQRRAGQNTAKMGYVKWSANRARMSAEFTAETGGLGHLALMRSYLGEGVMEDTERSRLILSRKTGMSQSEIDPMMNMLRELPMMQNRMRNEMRMVGKQREQSQRWNQYGPQAQLEKQKQKLRDAVLGPIDELRSGLQQAFTEAVEGEINQAMGVNQKFVSEATRDAYTASVRGGRGTEAAFMKSLRGGGLGPTQREQAQLGLFRGGTAAISELDALRAPGTLSMTGMRQRGAAGTFGRLMAGIGEQGRKLVGREGIGGFLGRQLMRASALAGGGAGAPDVAGSAQLANAYSTGNFGKDVLDELNMDSAAFEKAVNNDRVSRILVGGGDLQDKVGRVKDELNLDSDEQARAVISKVSKTKNYIDDIEFLSPKGTSGAQARNISEAMKDYINNVVGRDAKGQGAAAMRAGAGQWLANTELQRMVAKGAEPAAIMARAKAIYGEEAGKFFGLATTATAGVEEAARQQGMSADELMRQRIGIAGKLTRAAEGTELIRRMHESTAEDFAEARRSGTFQEVLAREKAGLAAGGRKGTRGVMVGLLARAGALYKGADLSKDTELLMVHSEMDSINSQILGMKPGDIDQMVIMARQGGMGAWANQMESATGRMRDIKKGTTKQARKRAAELALGGAAGAFEDILSKRGAKNRYELMAQRLEGMSEEQLTALGIQRPTDLAKRLRDIGGAGKDELAMTIATQESKLQKAEETAIEPKETEQEQLKEAQRNSYKDLSYIARDMFSVRMALGGAGGLRVKVTNEDDGPESEEKVATGGAKE